MGDALEGFAAGESIPCDRPHAQRLLARLAALATALSSIGAQIAGLSESGLALLAPLVAEGFETLVWYLYSRRFPAAGAAGCLRTSARPPAWPPRCAGQAPPRPSPGGARGTTRPGWRP